VKYVHQELEKDVQSISGTYAPTKELRLKHDGGEVLCIIGRAVVDTACCGSGSFMYATVPGYIVSWKRGTSDSGLPVSEVEPVRDDETRRAVARELREREYIYNIDFW